MKDDAIAHLSDLLMVITTRLQELEKKQQNIDDNNVLAHVGFSAFLSLCIWQIQAKRNISTCSTHKSTNTSTWFSKSQVV
jgi:hypothetical protein